MLKKLTYIITAILLVSSLTACSAISSFFTPTSQKIVDDMFIETAVTNGDTALTYTHVIDYTDTCTIDNTYDPYTITTIDGYEISIILSDNTYTASLAAHDISIVNDTDNDLYIKINNYSLNSVSSSLAYTILTEANSVNERSCFVFTGQNDIEAEDSLATIIEFDLVITDTEIYHFTLYPEGSDAITIATYDTDDTTVLYDDDYLYIALDSITIDEYNGSAIIYIENKTDVPLSIMSAETSYINGFESEIFYATTLAASSSQYTEFFIDTNYLENISTTDIETIILNCYVCDDVNIGFSMTFPLYIEIAE